MPKDIDVQLLRDFMAAESKRKILAKQAEAAEKEAKLLGERITEWLKSKGRKFSRRGPFHVSLVDGNTYPKWKDEFIRALGEEAANEIIAKTPPSVRLIVNSRE